MSELNTRQPNSAGATDEIDLLGVFSAIWKQRLLILAITLAVTICAALYAFLSTPQYQVKSVLRIAQLKDLDRLNSLGLIELDGTAALEMVGQELESYSLRQEFFEANPELFAKLKQGNLTAEQAFAQFNDEAFKVLWPPIPPKGAAQTNVFVGLEMTYPDGLEGAKILNELVRFVLQQGQDRVKQNIEVLINNRIEMLERKLRSAKVAYEALIESQIENLKELDTLKRQQLEDELVALRLELKIQRQNRLAALNEAIEIAQKLGIENPTTLLGMAQVLSPSRTSVISTGVAGQEEPLYFLGTRALRAERETLLARESDDFEAPRIAEIFKELELLKNNRHIEMLESRENEQVFLKAQAEIRSEIAGLESLRVDLSDIRLVRLDQSAVEPLKPVKPQRALIVLLALVGGLILGVMVALVRGLLQPASTNR
ncbi:Wzz/FepE/Etk N-terminal domain-containing protein [Paenalcaligenes suwonensis]|uniref:Wzz/FepE/Etk N-terminal domain-containing protein n=1 Tax=Paenalcaligenes suwonensis TaxID=1202713 RepID=UPI00140BBD7A|nr:Wzz/FepE/Etk N-terminal domain-containing protein [Paenalcaligenes suwonensis]NHC61483.1 chain-length determining protein [Paenalcaligenes suwonensis]